MKLRLPEKIETQRLVLERLKHEDAEEIFYTYASKPEATRFMAWPTHKSLKDTRSFLRYAVAGWEQGIDYSFAIRLNGNNRFIGSIGILNDNGKIQFGYVLSPTQWGNGYATEACSALIGVLKTIPEIQHIGTFVDVENVASRKVLLKAGLTEDFIFSKWFAFVNQNNELKDCVLFSLQGITSTKAAGF